MLKDTKQDEIKPNDNKVRKKYWMLMAQGLKQSKIAEHLFISYHTVENHKRNLEKENE